MKKPTSKPIELHFPRVNGSIDDKIDGLIEEVGVHRAEIVREMIIAALKAGQESDDPADLKLMNTTLKEMRFTGKIFSPYRSIRKVTVFGSARITPDRPVYLSAKKLGRALAEKGYMVITGGGPGVMQAVNEGAGPEASFGVNIRLPFEQRPNPVIDGGPRTINYKYFFNRKVAFLKETDAVVLFPGGFGTMDEAMETMTLVQTGKNAPLPILLFEEPGASYWKRWRQFLGKELEIPGYIGPNDLDLLDVVESVGEAVQIIDRFYSGFHSLRYVREKLVLRFLRPAREQCIRTLGEEFSDILIPGGAIQQTGPLPEEADEPDLASLSRLVIDFDRRSFARLRRLIDAVNDCLQHEPQGETQ
ncbi:MAG: TIGR00730 family Rossman fold protein [Desulfobacterales bacterium]|nr:TIGR00730 family Rossman fold protein [Desulfobacterales bacterium]